MHQSPVDRAIGWVIAVALVTVLVWSIHDARGQTPTPRFACSNGLTLVSDPFPLPFKPLSCKLYVSHDGSPESLLITGTTVAGTLVDPAAPAGSVACWFTYKFALGHWVITATDVDAGSESGHSLPYTYDCVTAVPPAAPTGMRSKTGTPLIP